ncbi:hypothetical protein SGM_5232 [Streptomyces griseoaurantiacus M045]|uniref:Uncharacterized protein n=1 Tax=Streptomyces griseoaurantiacus M045 TaxID=996637 RepID=F3NQF7_9ACTN|nr:DUF6153 family protein [Streptomyces griseoaurantiacus]EGG44417.1 hypothetical protein SGM_5232 [Streptomyces griseoaurantiacus M045]
MAVRAADGGSGAVRWAYGVLLTLCVALAVLVHHETSAMSAAPPVPRPVHAVHSIPDGAAPSVSDVSSHSAGGSGCAMPGMQHCGAAALSTVHLVLPGRSMPDVITPPGPAGEGRAPAAAVGRAPPDLSVLSQLRI